MPVASAQPEEDEGHGLAGAAVAEDAADAEGRRHAFAQFAARIFGVVLVRGLESHDARTVDACVGLLILLLVQLALRRAPDELRDVGGRGGGVDLVGQAQRLGLRWRWPCPLALRLLERFLRAVVLALGPVKGVSGRASRRSAHPPAPRT